MTTRRDFLARSGIALLGGLLVGDEALEAFARLTDRRMWTGFGSGMIDLHVTTGFRAGMFSGYFKAAGDKRIAKVLIDGVEAKTTVLPNGLVRAERLFGNGTLLPVDPSRIAIHGNARPIALQLEQGVFPSTFIPTGNAPATRAQDQLSFSAPYHFDGSRIAANHPWECSFERASGATKLDERGNIVPVPAGQCRTGHFVPGVGPAMLLEGERTNYILRQPLPSAF